LPRLLVEMRRRRTHIDTYAGGDAEVSMNAITERAMHDPVAPDEVDVLQGVFDAIIAERRLNKQSVDALQVARDVIRFYFDGIHDHDTLLDMVRAE
jgi:hypothetical protein